MKKTTPKRLAAASLIEGIKWAIDAHLDAADEIEHNTEERQAAQKEAWRIAEPMLQRLEKITGENYQRHFRK